jgi:hypothetical protein
MKIAKITPFLLFIAFVLSCSTPEEKMKKYMIGNWKTIYYKWELPTYQKKDTLVEYAFDYNNPDEKRPEGIPIYKFKEDGVFESWHERNGVAGKKTIGKWRVTQDSLFYDLTFKENPYTVRMKLSVIEDGYATNRLMDKDRDGEVDDSLYMETVRLPDDPKE